MHRPDRSALLPIGALILALMSAAGCASTGEMPQVNDRLRAAALEQGAAAEQVERGRALMTTACASCHVPVHPNDISMERWDNALPRMAAYAFLDAEEERDIRAYILAARAANN